MDGGLKGCFLDGLLCMRNAILNLRLKVLMSFNRVEREGFAGVGTKFKPLPSASFSISESFVLDRFVMNCSHCSARFVLRRDLSILVCRLHLREKLIAFLDFCELFMEGVYLRFAMSKVGNG